MITALASLTLNEQLGSVAANAAVNFQHMMLGVQLMVDFCSISVLALLSPVHLPLST